MLGIEPGSELTFIHDRSKKVEVMNDENQVRLENGEIIAISAATREFLNEMGREWKSARGGACFEYGEETLVERRKRIGEWNKSQNGRKFT